VETWETYGVSWCTGEEFNERQYRDEKKMGPEEVLVVPLAES